MIEFDIVRILLAFICGYFLSLSGSLSQLTTNNSLGSPSTLGMDGLGVLCVIGAQFFIHFSELEIPLEHTSFALFMTGLLFGILWVKLNGRRVERGIWSSIDMKGVVVAGLAFNLFVGAIFSIVQFLFMTLNFEFPTGIWFGNLRLYENEFLIPFLIVFFLSLGFVFKQASRLEILSLGKDMATSLKIDVSRLQVSSLLMALFLTGLVISYFGVFSFLGLIFPHILRSMNWFKLSMKRELLIGPFVCGLILSVIDVLCFNFTVYGAELPVGMVFSVLGAFLLIGLIFKSNLFKS